MICLTVPGFNPHGGIRILLEWANRLPDVTILNTSVKKNAYPKWFNLKRSVQITNNPAIVKQADILIIGSPHGIHLQDQAKNVFIFCQMAEHIFNEGDANWLQTCMKFYRSPHPMILISHWNHQWFKTFGRTAPTYYVGNGVNLEDFPMSDKPKDGKTVLLESPKSKNPAKDIQGIGFKVAQRLRGEGYKVISYGALPLNGQAGLVDEYHFRPPLKTLNELYERATILLKATRYDARSTAPIEAMTKGTVTARAIQLGDDDLIHNVNCLRGLYEEGLLYDNAKRLLTDSALRGQLATNCRYHVQTWTWDYYMNRIQEIIFNHSNAEKSLL